MPPPKSSMTAAAASSLWPVVISFECSPLQLCDLPSLLEHRQQKTLAPCYKCGCCSSSRLTPQASRNRHRSHRLSKRSRQVMMKDRCSNQAGEQDAAQEGRRLQRRTAAAGHTTAAAAAAAKKKKKKKSGSSFNTQQQATSLCAAM
jgi:hypothetical protein